MHELASHLCTVTFSILFGSMCGTMTGEPHRGLRSQQLTTIPKMKCSLIGNISERAVLSLWLRKHAFFRHRFPCDSPDLSASWYRMLCSCRQPSSASCSSIPATNFFACIYFCPRKPTLSCASTSSACSWIGIWRGGWPSSSPESLRRDGLYASMPRSCTVSKFEDEKILPHYCITGKQELRASGCSSWVSDCRPL